MVCCAGGTCSVKRVCGYEKPIRGRSSRSRRVLMEACSPVAEMTMSSMSGTLRVATRCTHYGVIDPMNDSISQGSRDFPRLRRRYYARWERLRKREVAGELVILLFE